METKMQECELDDTAINAQIELLSHAEIILRKEPLVIGDGCYWPAGADICEDAIELIGQLRTFRNSVRRIKVERDALLTQRDELAAVCEAVAALADGQGRVNLMQVAGQARAALAKVQR